MLKKIFRGVGYIISAALLTLCILLIAAAAAFGSENAVDAFGFNIFIVQNGNIPAAPKDSAVFVRKCVVNDLKEGNLTLYLANDEEQTALGYVKDFHADDGTYYATVTSEGKDAVISNSTLIGRADYASPVLGRLILFIRTPLGVLFLAVLPCVALVVYDILRAYAAKAPLPEVIPQVKNGDSFEDGQVLSAARSTGSKITVTDDGKAAYSKKQNGKRSEEAADVLFSYAGRQQRRNEERPIIPLTDKKAEIAKPPIKLPERPSSGYTSIINIDRGAEPKSEFKAEPRASSGTTAGKYAQNSGEVTAEPRRATSSKTAELPNIQKKDAGDAFFTQTDTPTFNEEALKRYNASFRAPQLGKSEDKPGTAAGRTARTARKRSTQIIASKGLDDLFSDDDDTPNRRRTSGDTVVDDILAGVDRKK